LLRLHVRPVDAGRRLQGAKVRDDRRRRHAEGIIDVGKRIGGPTANQRMQLQPRLGEVQLRRLDAPAVLQHRDPRPRGFERRDGTARQPPLVQVHELIQRVEVLARQPQFRLRLEDVDGGDGDIQAQPADRVRELRLGDRLRCRRQAGPERALSAALEDEIDARRILRRPCAVDLVESGAEPVEAVGAAR
jgi:hypothetical protein